MISIIIPIYNSDKFLDECLLSVTNQSYRDLEIICINDGSDDKSEEICNLWLKKDSRIKYCYQDNLGVCVARNRALDVAKGNYVCFVDADDVIHKDYIYNLVRYSNNDITVVCQLTRDDNLVGGGKGSSLVSNHDFIKDTVYERIPHPGFTCFLYDMDVIKRNKLRFTEGCVKNEDYEFYMKYLTYSGKEVMCLNYIGYYYRPNPSSVMFKKATINALTSIEASRQINKVLYDAGIIDDSEIILSNGVLTYTYSIAKQHNSELYDYLHEHYDVKAAMKKMVTFPRLSKKLVALTYLALGKRGFYRLVILH